MHYSAKRGIEIACRLLLDQDHKRWESLKVIARTISPTSSLGEHGEILGRLYRCGREQWRAGALAKAAISLKRVKIVKIDEKLLRRAYRNLYQRSFERYHPRPPTASPSPRLGVHNPNPIAIVILSQERLKLRTANLADTFRLPI